MLRLVGCELFKYKRNRILPVLTALAVLFPLALILMTGSERNGADTPAELHAWYDGLFNDNLVYSSMLLFPGLFGCVAAILFFAERDCDTFKSMRAIPITENRLILAKLIVMYLWSEVYCLCSTAALTLFCFLLEPAAVADVWFKLLCSMLTGVTMATVTLPAAVIVIYGNQSWLLSVLLSFLYAVANWLLLILFAAKDSILRWLPLLNGFFLTSRLWGWRKEMLGGEGLAALPLSEYIRGGLYLLGIFLICTLLIVRFYRKWSR
ncbi:MAG TPA: ABC transporter permease [Candidatus Eisenbergiella pullistercoris]|uniref:ABC transporter permease n=1 Tax=Candidatus Eisenbergiella pullistercoris TaxID=2838555 RepID=A0A9D1YQY5_9FIRM|nr:ABC transporter permease [Candidatus Eisenbergiella pullistercoris]